MRPLLIILILLLAALPVAGEVSVNVPFLHQEKNGCGAASVAMVMQYWSAKHPQLLLTESRPLDTYHDLYQPELRGITLAAMRKYLESHGFTAFTFRGNLLDIESQIRKGRPIVVSLRRSPKANLHFVVLSGLDTGWVWLNDPTKRKPIRMKRAKFERAWSRADDWLLLAAPTQSD